MKIRKRAKKKQKLKFVYSLHTTPITKAITTTISTTITTTTATTMTRTTTTS